MARKFTRAFTQQAALPAEAMQAAMSVLDSGRLHRYNLLPGETGDVSALEAEYRDWPGSSYCLAVTSGGQALQIAMRACGVEPSDVVPTNAFTLAPVPGAIAAVIGRAALVEVNENLRLDLGDLERKIARTSARFLLLSLMRCHLCDMEALMRICDSAGVHGDRGLHPHDAGALEWETVGELWEGRLFLDTDIQSHELGRRRVSNH